MLLDDNENVKKKRNTFLIIEPVRLGKEEGKAPCM